MAASGRQFPPGPPEPYDASQDLLSWMEACRARYGDIYQAVVHGGLIYVVNDLHHLQHILRKNWQNYRKGLAVRRIELLLGRGLIASEGEFWKNQRRMIQPAFHQDAIGRLATVIADVNAVLLRKWEAAARENKTINITQDINLAVLEMVLVSLFGDDYPTVASPFSVLAEEAARDLQFAQTFKPLRRVVAQIVAQRRAETRQRPDLLGLLMQARDRDTGRTMPDGQVITEIMTLIVAGHETTSATLGFAWHLLSKHPAVEWKLHDQLNMSNEMAIEGGTGPPRMNYAHQIIEETMRLYPAGWLMTRKALQDDHLDDYFVPAGTEIYFSPYIIQRHPDLWEAPDCFDPGHFDPEQVKRRPALAMLPFSAGPRNCIGEPLARLEMEIHLTTIAPKLRLRCIDQRPLQLELGVTLRSRHDFVMQPEIRTPVPCQAVWNEAGRAAGASAAATSAPICRSATRA